MTRIVFVRESFDQLQSTRKCQDLRPCSTSRKLSRYPGPWSGRYKVLRGVSTGQTRTKSPFPPPPPTLPLHTHCILSFFHDHFSIVLLFTLHLRRDTDRKKSHQVIVLVWCIVSKKLDGSNILKNLWNVLIYLSACEIALLSKLLYFNFYCQFILVLWYQ